MTMTLTRKDLICRLLKGIENGDPESVTVVNEDRYIQHNPQTHEGSEGLAVLFKRLAESNPRVNIVRVFEDGDYVFAHTEYDFEQRNIGFEIFRFQGEQAVEHWDNIQHRLGPNLSGHSMVDGETRVAESDKTESNRELITAFVEEVLINGEGDRLYDYIKWNNFVEHNPESSDEMNRVIKVVAPERSGVEDRIVYQRCHRVLAEGNFVLSVCEGSINQTPTAFYDLWRLAHNYIVEHWDTTEAIPPVEEWKNDNGKF